MGVAFIAYVLALWLAAAPHAPRPHLALDREAILRLLGGTPEFRPGSREVTNWRIESASHIAAAPMFALSVLAGQVPASVSRCVKLNNYWCIKRAGWAGEIAADGEGHVAFASAAEGARTAALLLRRYYVDFGYRSAASIVSHWAPAQCGLSSGGGRTAGLAVRGIGGTLRARWLARHGGSVHVRPGRSVVADPLLTMMRTPSIEADVAEVPLAPVSLAAVTLPGPAAKPGARPGAASGCASETRRIAGYAARVSAGLTPDPQADLKLFDSDGRSTPLLARVMANMTAVEIGPLRGDADLIAAAIERVDADHAGSGRLHRTPPGLPSPPR